MSQEQFKELLDFFAKSNITIMGDIVFEKHNEAGSTAYDLRGSTAKPSKQAEPKPAKEIKPEKPLKPTETMTFKRMSNVLEGHLTLLFHKLVKEGWIEGNEADFKALFSGKRDENCMLTWVGLFGKGTLVELFRQLIKAGLVVLKEGYTLSAVLEGHFVDRKGQWLTGLDKGDSPNEKALPMIVECVQLLQSDPRQLICGSYQDDEDFLQEYDPYDHQDINLHKRRKG